jgi:hypothetical protein
MRRQRPCELEADDAAETLCELLGPPVESGTVFRSTRNAARSSSNSATRSSTTTWRA